MSEYLPKDSIQRFLIERYETYFQELFELSYVDTSTFNALELQHLRTNRHKMLRKSQEIVKLLSTHTTTELEKYDLVELVEHFPALQLIKHEKNA